MVGLRIMIGNANNMSFESSFQEILKIEGGFVDHPNDKGGATKYGITIQTLSDFLGKEVSKEDIHNLDIETAKKIYKQNYWDRMKLDFVFDDELSDFLFDQAVNRGVRSIACMVQTAVGVKADGIIGRITLGAIDSRNPKKLLQELVARSQMEYVRIVESNPSQLVFLRGWLSRTHRFMT